MAKRDSSITALILLTHLTKSLLEPYNYI